MSNRGNMNDGEASCCRGVCPAPQAGVGSCLIPTTSSPQAPDIEAVDEIASTSAIAKRTATIQDTTNCFKYRYVMQLLVFFGMFLVYAMRVNLSVTITVMVENQNKIDVTNGGDSKYTWPSDVQGWILNSFFIGYASTQILGGYLAESFSVKWVFGYGIFLTSLLTLLSEAAVRVHYGAFIALRVAEGICEGVTYPSLYALCARWSPVSERTWMAGVANLGTLIGTVVALPVAAELCASRWGWPAVFYVFGAFGVVWSLAWYLFAASLPEKVPAGLMSEEEKRYIVYTRGVSWFPNRRANRLRKTQAQERDIDNQCAPGTLSTNVSERSSRTPLQQRRRVPWWKIVTSPAVWMVSLVKFTNSFVLYMILTEAPTYLHDVLKIDVQRSGWINSAGYLGNAVVSLVSSWLADFFIQRSRQHSLGFESGSVTKVRKAFECSAQLLGGLTIGAVAASGSNQLLAVTMLIFNMSVNGLTAGGDVALPIDIGPSHAGAIQSFSNTVSNVAGIIAPLFVGYMIKNSATAWEWSVVFYTTAGVSVFGALSFLIWGTAEIQDWAKENEDEESLVPDDAVTSN